MKGPDDQTVGTCRPHGSVRGHPARLPLPQGFLFSTLVCGGHAAGRGGASSCFKTRNTCVGPASKGAVGRRRASPPREAAWSAGPARASVWERRTDSSCSVRSPSILSGHLMKPHVGLAKSISQNCKHASQRGKKSGTDVSDSFALEGPFPAVRRLRAPPGVPPRWAKKGRWVTWAGGWGAVLGAL